MAAHNIGGQTIHRFFGLDNVEGLPNHMRLDIFVKGYSRIVFLVDEVSMISAELLDKMSKSLMSAKRSNVAFGGIPIIFFGDLAQLLPFSADNSPISAPIASNVFKAIKVQHVYHPCRQTDPLFFDVLSKIRLRQINHPSVTEALLSRVRFSKKPAKDSTILIAHKSGALRFNENQLNGMEGPIRQYKSYDECGGMGMIAYQALLTTSLPKVSLHKIMNSVT